MHPIEQLRYVARAAREGPALLAREAAGALATFDDDPAGLVTACRRLVDRQPTCGPMWWLAARVLGASEDGAAEAWRAAAELDDDTTSTALEVCLPDDAQVTVVGWPEQAAAALRRRGDARVLVVDAAGEGAGLVRRLTASGVDAHLVPESGLGAAAAVSDLVLVEARAMGPSALLALAGSRAAAAVAAHAGRQVWAVAGVGRVLPGLLWDGLTRRLANVDEPWALPHEVVPLDLVHQVVGPGGPQSPQVAGARAHCPATPELLKELG